MEFALRNAVVAWSKKLVVFGKSLILISQYLLHWRIRDARYMHIGELDYMYLLEGMSVSSKYWKSTKTAGILRFFRFPLSPGVWQEVTSV